MEGTALLHWENIGCWGALSGGAVLCTAIQGDSSKRAVNKVTKVWAL